MQRDYELGIILHPEVSEEGTRATLDRVATIVANHDGQIVKVNQWGRRRLAYPIEHQRDGFYVFIDMILTPETVIELERTLKVSEVVLRHMMHKRDHKLVVKEREEREEREAREARAAAAPTPVAETPVAVTAAGEQAPAAEVPAEASVPATEAVAETQESAPVAEAVAETPAPATEAGAETQEQAPAVEAAAEVSTPAVAEVGEVPPASDEAGIEA